MKERKKQRITWGRKNRVESVWWLKALLRLCILQMCWCVLVDFRSAFLECILYLSGQEITSFSRHGHWVHKGLWVIGNPDGCAWASRKKRLPQKSKPNIPAIMLTELISVSAPLFIFLLFLFSSYFLHYSATIGCLLRFFFPIHLSYEWGWAPRYNWLKSWVGRPMGTNQQSMYKRTGQLSNILHTQLIPVVPCTEQLLHQC